MSLDRTIPQLVAEPVRIEFGPRDAQFGFLIGIARAEIRPLIDSVFPFADAKAAISHFESADRLGRVVIENSAYDRVDDGPVTAAALYKPM